MAMHSATSQRLVQAGRMLTTLSYKSVLDRGFAVIRGDDGHMIASSKTSKKGSAIQIEFADGSMDAIVAGAPPKPKSTKPLPKDDTPSQGSLL